MGYVEDDSLVRVDFFKTTGKWYDTASMKWDRYHSVGKDGSFEDIRETFKRCVKEQFKNRSDMMAVCLHPYHEHSHPVSFIPTLRRNSMIETTKKEISYTDFEE